VNIMKNVTPKKAEPTRAEEDDDASLGEAFANFAARETLDRMEELLETQNELVEKLVNKLVSDRAGAGESRVSYKVKVVRDSKGLISELEVTPVTQTRVVN
jgi:hypothetical protein